MPQEPVLVARPPVRSRQAAGGIVQMVLPVLGTLGIVAFAVVMPNRLFLIVACVFVAISIVTVVATQWSQRRTGKRSARGARRLYRAHLARRDVSCSELAVRQREIDERLYPDPVRLVGAGLPPPATCGSAGPTTRTSSPFASAARPSSWPARCGWTSPTTRSSEYEPELLAEAQALIERHRTVDALSVVTSLAGADVITLIGDRARITGLTRSLLAQAATFRAPSDLRIMTAFDAERRRGLGAG